MGIIEDNLHVAITGEFNAIQKYIKFAEIAEAEHMLNVAYIFKALVSGEMIHLANHNRALGKNFTPELKDFEPGNTLENLKTAFAAETWEYKEMYPSLIKSIKKENSEKGKIAKLSMTWAKDVEITHAEVLRLVISFVEQDMDFNLDGKKLWVCQACGNLFIGDNPNKMCPVCKHSANFYREVQK
jgi:rubrerythrin